VEGAWYRGREGEEGEEGARERGRRGRRESERGIVWESEM